MPHVSGKRNGKAQCAGKKRFETHRDALAEAQRYARQTGACEDELRAYPCYHCKKYHWGHRPLGRRR